MTQRPPAYEDRLRPGQYLGMMGDGQLGRMFCHAAQAMGYHVVAFGGEANGPTAQVAEQHICAAYDDEQALAQLASQVRAVTTEFENVPAQSLKQLSYTCRTTPGAAAVAVVQDRIAEKAFIASQGVPVAPHQSVHFMVDLETVDEALFPGILKAARFGYDGKGQVQVEDKAQAQAAFKTLGEVPCVLEAKLPLAYEISVIAARNHQGEIAVYPVGVNHHVNGILSATIVYEGIVPQHIVAQAHDATQKLLAGMNYVGVMCVEFFVLDGEQDQGAQRISAQQDNDQHDNAQPQLVVNEIAPRPHNSGHYTINACPCSQFEQQVRVMAGLPLGDTRLVSPAVMLNLLGDAWFEPENDEPREPDWASVLALPGVSLHLYGKHEVRKGRKMGHINIVHPEVKGVLSLAQQVSAALGLGAPLMVPAVPATQA